MPGLLVVRAQGRLYFANVQRVTEHVLALVDQQTSPPRVVVLDASAIPDMEFTALRALADLDHEVHTRGVALWLAGLHRVPGEMVQRALTLYEGPPVRCSTTSCRRSRRSSRSRDDRTPVPVDGAHLPAQLTTEEEVACTSRQQASESRLFCPFCPY